jgi:RNA polymerase sigma factor (sigma-70 family)
LDKDFEIWEKFKTGDKSALSSIYFIHFPSMLQYGLKFQNDQDFIKDCIQDVFFKLIEAGVKLGTTSDIKYYLFKALKNAIIKELQRKHKIARIENFHMKFDATFSLEDDLIELENAKERQNKLLTALRNLSERQREIIYLRYECGMEYTQICELMNLKMDSARKLVFRAIKSLKDAFGGDFNTVVLFFCNLCKKHAL